jgi:hypothetical protein
MFMELSWDLRRARERCRSGHGWRRHSQEKDIRDAWRIFSGNACRHACTSTSDADGPGADRTMARKKKATSQRGLPLVL